MPELLKTIAAYIPPNIVRDIVVDPSPVPPTEVALERFPAAVLFADISGFTPLTEALAQKGAEGPEELTRLLNRYFGWMIAFIETEGGEIVKFGGDALIAVFRAGHEGLSIATRRATQTAETMQSVMDEFKVIESSVGLVTLAMKIGIGAGEVLAARVGGLYDRWEYIVAGDPILQAAQAENQARQNEIVLSREARAMIDPDPVPMHPLSRIDWSSIQQPHKIEAALRCYVPAPVLDWLDEGLHRWLASLRPMSVLFVKVDGLDYEQDSAIDQLHGFVQEVQEVVHHYQGSLPRLTVDDKGTVLLLLFGAPPYAHEDDPERALRCALDLQSTAKSHQLQLSIGITTGRVFAGPVGGETRREYTVMGDTVNLAAHLMTAAEPGQISCTYEVYRSARSQMKFELLPPVQVKGKGGSLHVYQPTGKRRSLGDTDRLDQIRTGGESPVPIRRLVGRQAEQAVLTANLESVQVGEGRVFVIEGGAGIGKSKLVQTFVRSVLECDLTPLIGRGRSIEQDTPYHGWHDIFEFYFRNILGDAENDGESADEARRWQQIQAWVEEQLPDQTPYLPLLNDLVDLNFPANPDILSLNSTTRHEAVMELLAALLRVWAAKQPLILVLEDAQWLDPVSWNLAVSMARQLITENLPLFLVIAMRPILDSASQLQMLTLSGMAETEFLRLDSLPDEEILNVAAARLGLTGNELPEDVAELIRRRAGGNPFFAEELIYALLDSGFIYLKTPAGPEGRTRCLISDDLLQADQILPATIQSTVLSRLDRLPPEQQLMLRIAAVIGQTFSYTTLRDTLSEHLQIDEANLQTLLNDLVYLDLIQPVSQDSDQLFSFKHVITREVTHQSLLFDWRRRLHRTVAKWYEDKYGQTPAEVQTDLSSTGEFHVVPRLQFRVTPAVVDASTLPYYALLVYHWHQAEDEAREGYYAALMAEQKMAQFAYAEALGYLNRALDLTAEDDLTGRFKLLLARETVYACRGHRQVQAQDLTVLAILAEAMQDERRQAVVALRRAYYAEAVSNYADALTAAQQAVAYAQKIQDVAGETQGYIALGRVFSRQAAGQTAKEMFELALSLSQNKQYHHSEAESLFSLGQVLRLQSEYAVADTYNQQALQICRAEAGFPVLEAAVLNELGLIQYFQGNFQSARDYFEQAMLMAYTVGHQREGLRPFYNVGLIYLRRGNYNAARDYLEQSLDIAREIEDRKIEAEILNSLGVVYCCLGDFNTSRSYLAHSLEIHEDIGNEIGQADSFGKFGMVFYTMGDFRTTQRYCQLALTIHQTTGHREGEAYGLLYMGHAQLGLGNLQEAETCYDRALRLRREMEQPGPALDVLAGLAEVALARQDIDLARQLVNEILARLETNREADLDNPARVYWSCYRVLESAGQTDPDHATRAQTILEATYALVQERAANLRDKVLRHLFLEQVNLHQAIVSAWKAQREP